MNSIAQQALARAMARPAVTTPAPQPVCPVPATTTAPVQAAPAGPESRLLYLEGRQHASEIVLSEGVALTQPGGAGRVLDNLRRCAVGKPPSFARGVAEIIELLEREVGHG